MFIFTVLVAVVVVVVCVFIYSPVREGSTFLVLTGFQLFRKELTPVRKVSADVNLKRFQHKLLKASRKPTLNMGEFRVAEPIPVVVDVVLDFLLFHSFS